MAAKGAKPVGTSGKDMARRIVDAAFDLAASRGWEEVTLADIADAAGVGLADTLEVFPTKGHVLAAFIARIDHHVLAGWTAEGMAESPRERLFDLLMRRFDALQPHREALAAILRGSCRAPASLLIALPRFQRSMAAMLEAAGVSSEGIRGLVLAQGLAAIHLNAARVWLDDDTADLGRTMAALDRGLARAEGLMAVAGRRRQRRREAPTE